MCAFKHRGCGGCLIIGQVLQGFLKSVVAVEVMVEVEGLHVLFHVNLFDLLRLRRRTSDIASGRQDILIHLNLWLLVY